MFSVKFATDLGQALLTGEGGGVLVKILQRKLEEAGRDLLLEHLPASSGGIGRLRTAIATGGQSEFNRARDQFLNQFRPRQTPYSGMLRRLESSFLARGNKRRRRIRPGTWQASNWATSRQDWLDNRWRHDWRSQPRDALGRWIPGRLDYIAADLQWRGKRTGRVVLRRRKRRTLRKRETRKRLRRLVRTPHNGR